MAVSTAPYRLQIFLEPEVRKALRDVAHHEDVSIQKLVTSWLVDKLRSYPAGQDLPSPDKPS